MKLKVLLTPVLIVVIVVFIIWVIVPSFMAIQTQLKNQSDLQSKLSDIQTKTVMAGKLAQELSASAAQEDSLNNYLPDSRKVEDIVSELNSVADNSGVSISNLSLDQSQGNIGTAMSPAANAQTATSPSGKPVSFDVDYGIIGSYSNIKSVIEELSKLARFNSIDSLKITEASSGSGQSSAPSQGAATNSAPQNYLQADMTLVFNYLPNTGVADISNSIFTSGNFDMSVVDNIKNKTNANAAEVSVGTAGTTNPFLP